MKFDSLIKFILYQEAFTVKLIDLPPPIRYLGADEEAWKEWDATELLKKGKLAVKTRILCDQGTDDGFLPKGQLLPGKYEELQ